MTALSLVEFLEARLREEEAAARAVEEVGGDIQRTYYDRLGVATTDGAFDRVWLTIDPARVLAQVAAIRAVVENHATLIERAERETGSLDDPAVVIVKAQGIVARSTLRALAQAWASHPDSDPAWEVGA